MLYINITIVILSILLFLILRNYNKDLILELDKKEHPLLILYPIGFFLYDKFHRKLSFMKHSSGIGESLKELYVLESSIFIEKVYICKKLVISLFVFFLFNTILLFSNINSQNNPAIIDGSYIKRPGIADGSKSLDVSVYLQEEDKIQEEELQLRIDEKEYTLIEFNEIVEAEIDKIDSYILGNNTSLETINEDLNLIRTIPGTPIQIEWTTSDISIIEDSGRVRNEGLEEEQLIELIACISYKGYEAYYHSFVTVKAKIYTKEELDRKNLLDLVEETLFATRTDEIIRLPKALHNYTLIWEEQTNTNYNMLFLFGIVVSILLYSLMDKELQQKVEKRNQQLLLDYPEMVHKFTLYVGAGMSLFHAWEKIVNDYMEQGREKRYLYDEMLVTYKELMVGTSEVIAYERFGRRIGLLPYLRFTSYLGQNTTKGNRGLLEQLELEVMEAFAERKELAKRLGEEAGTKLLFPMMIMLFLVLLIIIVPAFSSISL